MEVLRSTFLPENVLGGAKLFLEATATGFQVSTRWQLLARRKNLNAAITIFENLAIGCADKNAPVFVQRLAGVEII